ncbi:MAG: DUF6268 family outer membrane beta-barrel protein [Myxococcota bacterium]
MSNSLLADVTLQQFDIALGFPIISESSGTIVFPSLGYTYVRSDTDLAFGGQGPVSEQSVSSTTQLHNPNLKLTLVQELSASWTLMALGGVGVASDFEGGFDRDGIVYTGLVMGNYAFSDRLTLGVGVLYSRIIGNPVTLPVVSVEWYFARGQMRLKGFLPARLSLDWKPAEPWIVSLGFALSGQNYHLNELDRNASISRASLGPSVTYGLGPINIQVSGGYTFLRQLDVLDDSGNTVGDEGLDNGFIVNTTIWLGKQPWLEESPRAQNPPPEG